MIKPRKRKTLNTKTIQLLLQLCVTSCFYSLNMKLLESYEKALQEIYDHVGFVENYVVYPINDNTEYFWDCDGKNIFFADTEKEFKDEDGNYYESEVYTQRFYQKWIYEGKDFTIIFEDTHTDGMKYFSVFDNAKRLSK